MSAGLLVLLALMGLAAGGVAYVDSRVRNGHRLRNYESARWATRRDLRPLRVKGPEKGRIILGRRGRQLIAAEPQRSVIVFGPTRTSYKTTGLAIPALKEWQGPAIATSVKTDLLLGTLAEREARGEVAVFEPTGTSGHGNVRISPLSDCGTWHGALRVAHWLCTSGKTSAGGLEDSSFWYTAAERLLAPLLFAAAREHFSMAQVMTWLGQGLAAKDKIHEILDREGEEAALDAWAANCGREERHRSSVYSTAETILSAFADPGVLKATSEPNFTVDQLLNQQGEGAKEGTLYLLAPRSEQKRLGILFATLIAEAIAWVDNRFAEKGRPLDPALLLLLDEAANLAPLPELPEIAATVAGEGVQLVTIFQDLAQLRGTYGRGAESIANNHAAKLFGAGLADPGTLDLVQRLTGKAEVARRSETKAPRGSSSTEGGTYLDIVPPMAVRQQRPGDAVLVYGQLPAVRLQLATRETLPPPSGDCQHIQRRAEHP
jgi:type IV secretion system protein VirD4